MPRTAAEDALGDLVDASLAGDHDHALRLGARDGEEALADALVERGVLQLEAIGRPARVARPRQGARTGSTSITTVRSGTRPPVAARFSWSTSSSGSPRA